MPNAFKLSLAVTIAMITLICAAGCNVVTPVAYAIHGPGKVEPQYTLEENARTVIFVEHDMDVVRDISDWVVVMAEGAIIAEGTPDHISQNREVIDAYLGAHHDLDLDDDDDGDDGEGDDA